jgi:hypothetical protein
MFAEQIEKMKRQYTDKYVVVDPTRPELARFRDVVGRVKTVNMSGRALVEFDDYHLNIGWYDIDPEFLKVVDKPPPKAPKAEAKKPAAKAEVKPAAAKPVAKPAPAAAKGGKPSVADILAAARGGKTGGAAPAAPKAEVTAPAKPQAAAAAPAKVDRSKMSVADMLAAARAGGAAGSAATASPPTAKPKELEPAASEATEVPAPAKEATPAAAAATVKRVDKSKMTIDEIVAYCREHDAK